MMVYVSLIIPIYNCANELKELFCRLDKQNDGSFEWEILLIDDGSFDGSTKICSDYCKNHRQYRFFHQSNHGVSSARNIGIKNALGKYLFFLDSDDDLGEGTIKSVCSFFDSVYDKTDLVTYPIITVLQSGERVSHFRYQYLKDSGVYNLESEPYIGQTTMNIVVKNKFENNILFDEHMSFTEDQKYCCEVCMDKLTMGYTPNAKYIYYRDNEGAAESQQGACFIFEQCTSFFEELFSKYERVPLAFQGLFINDMYWKLQCGILLPHHYTDQEYQFAVRRLKLLLNRCNPYVILNHPNIDFYEKFFFLRIIDRKLLDIRLYSNAFGLLFKDNTVMYENKVEIVITKFCVSKKIVRVRGFLKTVFFHFFCGDVRLYVRLKRKKCSHWIEQECPLNLSTHNYYQFKEATQKFLSFVCDIDVSDTEEFCFFALFNGISYDVTYYFQPLTPFSHIENIRKYYRGDLCVKWGNNNHFFLKKSAITHSSNKSIWLYTDSITVSEGDALYQYIHDYKINDGIRRVYVITNDSQLKKIPSNANIVFFGSHMHRRYVMNCEKLITSFAEPDIYLPFDRKRIEKMANKIKCDIIYLQHGVLHAFMPWYYSAEHMFVDRIVVSTQQEKEIYLKNGFLEDELITCGAPRFDKSVGETIKRAENVCKRRILYAPSWRRYLLGNRDSSGWNSTQGRLIKSSYYKKIVEFLNNDRLNEILCDNDTYLDVKLHPNFASYYKEFDNVGNRIRIIREIDDKGKYELLITDISSYIGDFARLKKPLISYIPDKDEFYCGMHTYRTVYYPADFKKTIVYTPEAAIDRIEDYLIYGIIPSYHVDFYNTDNSMKELYEYLMHM